MKEIIPDQIKNINMKKGKIVINVKNTNYEIVKKVFKEQFNFKLSTSNDLNFDLYWTDQMIAQDIYFKLKPYQKINYIPGIEQICRKNLLIRNLMQMSKEFPDQYNYFPKTWQLPQEFRTLKNNKEINNQCYILKPENGCQGKGIILLKNMDQLIYQEQPYIVQEYISNPLLIDKLKWDLRLYVLLGGTDPLRIFLYDEGMARFATQEYQSVSKYHIFDMNIKIFRIFIIINKFQLA